MTNLVLRLRGAIASLATVFRVAVLSFVLLALPQIGHAQSFQFSSFSVAGQTRVELPALLGFAGLNAGQSYSAGELNEALQRLQETGLFRTVAFVPQGGRLQIRVEEYPVVNRVAFEGNRILSDEVAATLISTQERRVFNPAQVEADTNAIVDAYQDQGRFGAEVIPRIIERTGNRVDVVFEIVEGRVVEIERVSFVGNRSFSDSRLRRVLQSKQAGALRAIINKDTFIEDRLEFDKAVLRDFYLSRGYLDFQINSVATEFSRERNGFFITINVTEGQQFKFGEITTVSEIPDVDAADFERLTRIREGRSYTPTLVDNAITRMEQRALRMGLNLLRVDPRVSRDEPNLEVDIEFALVEGPRVLIERIDIEGNASTLDRVIRRQFRIAEGDPFNPREMREAAERIRALGLFESASVNTRQGSAEDSIIVDVGVDEALTGSLVFGAAYNLATGIGATATYRERNFRGRGQTLNFDFKIGLDNADGGVTFIEPSFMDRDLQLRFDGEYRQTEFEYTDYDTQTYLFRPSIGFPLSEQADLSLRYSFQGDRIFNVNTGSSALLTAEEAEGLRTRHALGYTLTYDSRTTGVDTNAGFLVRLAQDYALHDDGATSLRTTGLVTAETKVWRDQLTLRATLEGGALNTMGADSRLNDRFFLTSNRMRGFAPAGVGPRDLTATNQDALGGNYFGAARFETEFPLGLPEEFGLSGGLFYDVGSVWGLDNTLGGAIDDDMYLRHSAGVSIYWTLPIGPLRFNFSRVLDKQSYDTGQNFDLTISTQF